MDLTELRRKTDLIDGSYQALKKQEKELDTTIGNLKKEIDILTKVSAVFKHLLDIMVKNEIDRMSSLITYGLKTIFDDQDLTFTPVITKKNDKIFIELNTLIDGVEVDYESFGGSVATIESFLLRILCIIKKKFARLMLLDETFAAVGDEYIPNTSDLVSQLSKKLGIDVLLVTHKKEFQHGADNVYRVKKGSNGLEMEKIK